MQDHPTRYQILDDVWDARDAQPFNILGEHGKLLVTTRKEDVSHQLGAEPRPLGELATDDALELLARYAGVPRGQLPPEAPRLAHECGELPLALALAGALVRGRPRDRWRAVLHRLTAADFKPEPGPYTPAGSSRPAACR